MRRRPWRVIPASLVALCLGMLGNLWVSSPVGARPNHWTVTQSANTSSPVNMLRAVSCAGPSFCVAVGESGPETVSQTLIETFNGTAWSITPSPNPSPSTASSLNDVSCTSPTFCVAVGSDVFSVPGGPTFRNTLIETFNGSTWSVTPSPFISFPFTELYGVSCTSPSFCVAVGNSLIETFNGTAWSVTLSPPGNLFGVSCTSPSFCQAVGEQFVGHLAETLVETFNGTTWSVTPSPNTSSLVTELSGVSCTSPSFCVAIGAGSTPTLIETFNGTAWSITPSPNLSGSPSLNGVSCASPTSCVAVGYVRAGNLISSPIVTLIESFNGTSWSLSRSPNVFTSGSSSGASANELFGVSCTSSVYCVAAGWAVAVNPPFQTLIETGVSPAPTMPFDVRGSGVISSVVQNQTTFSGTVTGTLIGSGTFVGSETTEFNPPPCASGPGAPATGSNTTTAANGDTLNSSFSGIVCISTSTSTSTTYQVAGQFTINGGTGRFTNATGGGSTHATATLSATAEGSRGPVTYEDIGTIRLAH